MPSTPARASSNTIELEQAVLGGLLHNLGLMIHCTDLVPEDFTEQFHAHLYTLLRQMHDIGETGNLISIMSYLPQDEKIDPQLTVKEYVIRLYSHWLGKASFAIQVEELRQWSQVRRLEVEAERFLADLHNRQPGIKAYELVAAKVADLVSVVRRDQAAEEISLRDAADTAMQKTAHTFRTREVNGFDTGYQFLNSMIGPIPRGHYMQIGADTKVGKSALALQIAEAIARQAPVLYFSFEMSADLLARRRVAAETGIGTRRQRQAKINESEFEQMSAAAGKLADRLFVVTKKMTAQGIFDYAKMFKMRHGDLGCLVVDHLGLVAPGRNSRSDQDWDVAQQASKMLKEAALELDCVAIGLSQVTKSQFIRNAERIADKIRFALRRPSWRDMKGGIAQDADLVLMPYRPAAVLDQVEPPEGTDDYLKWREVYDLKQHVCEIHLVLAREEDFPKIESVRWDGPRTQFLDLLDERDDPGFGGF